MAVAIYERWKIKAVEQKQMATLLLKQYQQSYERNLQNELRKLGRRKKVQLTNKTILNSLRIQANRDARSIANTYNKELLTQIAKYGDRVNNGILEEWSLQRDIWKSEQIAVHTEMEAKVKAKSDFIRKNRRVLKGQATLRPSKYGDSICRVLLSKNPYTLEVASKFKMPHVGCIHYMDTKYAKVSEDVLLWSGEDVIVRHLPDKHRQKDHGRKGSSNKKVLVGDEAVSVLFGEEIGGMWQKDLTESELKAVDEDDNTFII